jgi:hypothetical protein
LLFIYSHFYNAWFVLFRRVLIRFFFKKNCLFHFSFVCFVNNSRAALLVPTLWATTLLVLYAPLERHNPLQVKEKSGESGEERVRYRDNERMEKEHCGVINVIRSYSVGNNPTCALCPLERHNPLQVRKSVSVRKAKKKEMPFLSYC